MVNCEYISINSQTSNQCRLKAPDTGCGTRKQPLQLMEANSMSTRERLIVVIDPEDSRARNLKELIEFMDAPAVRVASPRNWRSQIGEHRLAAVFLGEDIPKKELDLLIADVGEYDPNVSIVLVGGEASA
jgi:hypothetical protein